MGRPQDQAAAVPLQPAVLRRIDAAIVVLLLVLAGWALVAAQGRPEARPVPAVSLLVGMLVAGTAGRHLGARTPRGLPAVIAIGVAGAFVLGLPESVSAGGGPTGYANANADLAVFGAALAAGLLPAARTLAERRGLVALTGVHVAALIATRSAGAMAISIAVLVLAWLSVRRRDASPSVAGGLVVACLALGLTAAISHGATLGGLHEQDGVRRDLWAVAAGLASDNPVRGTGPGTFELRNPVSDDADLRWAHHDHLQVAAELGLVGLALLLAAIGVLYARLWGQRDRCTATVVGAAALTLVVTHASIDHVLHHPAVPLTLAVLVGWATAAHQAPGSRGSPRPRR